MSNITLSPQDIRTLAHQERTGKIYRCDKCGALVRVGCVCPCGFAEAVRTKRKERIKAKSGDNLRP
ncbi:MAG: hypothetical protein M0R06_16270 [Sphaerochaeta sp.]|jgi:hypothetical protein|nr:hypothetical protein [Sphaerochaeta sp.]